MGANMVSFSSFRYFVVFILLNVCLKSTAGDSNLTFSFKNFGKDSNFESQLALFGDVKVANDSLSGQTGRVICKKPINLVEEYSRKMVSFSNNFVFSMSKPNGDGLAFVMLPMGYPLNAFDGGSMGLLGERKMKFLAVEFDTFKDDKYGDVNDNHVGFDVESPVSVKVSNVSSIGLVLNSGRKLQAWIDYEASSKRFEVRLCKFGDVRPVDPLLTYAIDLSRFWKGENVSVGLSSSSSGNSSQKVNLYSWRFKSRTFSRRMHSEPLDPEHLNEKGKEELKVSNRSDCAMRIFAALIFGAGCGILGAFLVLFVWSFLGNRRPVVPVEFVVQPEECDSTLFPSPFFCSSLLFSLSSKLQINITLTFGIQSLPNPRDKAWLKIPG